MISVGRPLCLRKRIARENRVLSLEGHFDDLVDHILHACQILHYDGKQFSLQRRKHLRDDDHQARMQFLFCVQLPEISGIVRYERKIFLDDPRHQIPVGFAAQSQPIHMETIMAVRLRHGHERCVKAFIDKKVHEVEPKGLETFSFRRLTRFTDFTFKPCSESFRGRPLAGWAATQISASSTIRSLSEG